MSSITNVNVSSIDTRTDRTKQIIQNFVKEGKSFTVLDVSNAIKQDGGDFVRHRDIRPIVYNIIDLESVDGLEDYIMTVIEVDTPKGTQYATLFHLEDEDPDEYKNRQQKALTPSEIKTDNTSSQNDDKDNTDNFSGAKKVRVVNKRKDGAIEIPIDMIDEDQSLCGIEIINHPNSITIKINDFNLTAKKKLSPGMRIYKTTLKKSNLTSSTIKICKFTNKIVLS